MQIREESLYHWLENYFKKAPYTLTKLSGDASFRRYFRIRRGDETFVLMDAPPDKEPLTPFLTVQSLLSQAQICVPTCFAQELTQGFLLLSDFGDDLLLHSLTEANTNVSYESVIKTLIQLQSIAPDTSQLPHFDASHIVKELAIFETYFLNTYLQLNLTASEKTLLKNTFAYLTQQLAEQPQVVIHRDYHSRNIMRLPNDDFGIIDFQDAMIGPWTYDLVSLLKDCYIEWPKARRDAWRHYFYTLSPFHSQFSEAECAHFFELCGLQRHLKVLGIFSRLAIRDKKMQYLNFLPLTLRYVQETLKTLSDLSHFAEWMTQKVKLP